MKPTTPPTLLITIALATTAACGDDFVAGYPYGSGADTGINSDAGTGADSDDGPQGDGQMYVYYEPTENEVYLGFEDAFRSNAVFEGLGDWITSWLALPEDLHVYLVECGEVNAYYNPANRSIAMCYELLYVAVQTFRNGWPDWDDEQVGNAAIATWLYVFFHELGHGLVDIMDIPFTGQEEDAVDDFSTVLLIEDGSPEVALSAAAFWRATDDGDVSLGEMADEHGLNMQRFYNILCLVYGSDPAAYGAIIDSFPEMSERADRCPGEYVQKSDAWERLLEPWLL